MRCKCGWRWIRWSGDHLCETAKCMKCGTKHVTYRRLPPNAKVGVDMYINISLDEYVKHALKTRVPLDKLVERLRGYDRR